MEAQASKYSLCNGELFKAGPDRVLRLCVYGEQIPKILVETHDSFCGGHFEAKVTARKILRSGYFWPGMFANVHRYCKSCDQCQRFVPILTKVGGLFPKIPGGLFSK